ncbi:hypothetical protein ACFWAN_49545 [Streptomyces mirabilis]|uniref:hypothetical protein n=1 Tax=Streptomyces mirabilis TaxID=68239 RepID=UPI0036655E9A
MTAIRCPAYRDRSLWWLVCDTRAPAPAPSGARRSNSFGMYASPFNPVATTMNPGALGPRSTLATLAGSTSPTYRFWNHCP